MKRTSSAISGGIEVAAGTPPAAHWAAIPPTIVSQMTIFASATHARLGAGSPAGMIDRYVARAISELVVGYTGIAVCGGALGVIRTARLFTFADMSWRSLADMQVARMWPCAAYAAGRLYVFGGLSTVAIDSSPDCDDEEAAPRPAYGDPVASVEVYDQHTDSWRIVTTMPMPRAGSVTEVVDGRVYLIGGHSPRSEVPVCDAYDPALDAWFPVEAFPADKFTASAAIAVGKDLFVVGDATDGTCAAVLDTTTGTWSRLPNAPERLGVVALTADEDRHAIRVYNSWDPPPPGQQIDMDTRRWSAGTMPLIGYANVTVTAGNRVYGIGWDIVAIYDDSGLPPLLVHGADFFPGAAAPVPF